MNSKRLLRVLKFYLKLTSYSPFEVASTRTFAVSGAGSFSSIFIGIVYIFALYTHYMRQSYFEPYNFLSTFFYRAIYLHLWLGMPAQLMIWIGLRKQHGIFHRLVNIVNDIPSTKGPRLTAMECLAYFKIFGNLLIWSGLSAYNLVMLNWNDFAVYKLMLFLGLFLPHFIIANILIWFCVSDLVVLHQISQLKDQIEKLHAAYTLRHYDIFGEHVQRKRETESSDVIGLVVKFWQNLATNSSSPAQNSNGVLRVMPSVSSAEGFQQKFQAIIRRGKSLLAISRDLNGALQGQLVILMLQHLLVVVIAVHCFLKMLQQWRYYVPPTDLIKMEVNFQFWLILIGSDVVCLVLVGTLHKRMVSVVELRRSFIANSSLLQISKLRKSSTLILSVKLSD